MQAGSQLRKILGYLARRLRSCHVDVLLEGSSLSPTSAPYILLTLRVFLLMRCVPSHRPVSAYPLRRSPSIPLVGLGQLCVVGEARCRRCKLYPRKASWSACILQVVGEHEGWQGYDWSELCLVLSSL